MVPPDPGIGSEDALQGNSLLEFYNYLLTPRQNQSWSGSGAYRRFGPDRFSSISPENLAAAQDLLQMMTEKDTRDRQVRRGDTAEEAMRGFGRQGGGGQITMGDTTMDVGGAPDTLNVRGMAEAAAGGVPIPLGGAGTLPGQYDPSSSRGRLTEGQIMTDNRMREKAANDATSKALEKMAEVYEVRNTIANLIGVPVNDPRFDAEAKAKAQSNQMIAKYLSDAESLQKEADFQNNLAERYGREQAEGPGSSGVGMSPPGETWEVGPDGVPRRVE